MFAALGCNIGTLQDRDNVPGGNEQVPTDAAPTGLLPQQPNGSFGTDPAPDGSPNTVNEPVVGTMPQPDTANAPAVPVGVPNGAQAGNTVVGADGNYVFERRYPYAFVGRFDLRDPNRVGFNFPGSKIGVAFTGTSLAMQLATTTPTTVNGRAWGDDTFDVDIDGVHYVSPGNAFAISPSDPLQACLPATMVPAADGNKFPGCVLAVHSADFNVPTTYPIATNLTDGNHVAWITKRNEFLQGSSGMDRLFGFSLSAGGKLLPPPAYLARRIEFVGDSSYSGYGGGQRNPCGYSTRNADVAGAPPHAIATYLHAESVNLSSSGQAIFSSYYDRDPTHNLPVLYRQTQGLDASTPYDFRTDRVDAVVLSSGGDDLYGANGNGYFANPNTSVQGLPEDNFVAAYVDFLTFMRSVRPEATFFVALTHGAYSNDVITLGGALQRAVATRNAAGDPNVVYFSYWRKADAVSNPKNYGNQADAVAGEKLWLGCTGHPSPGLSRYLATLIGPFIAQRMGWQDVGF